jgi:signal transduction histidine kinase
VLGIAEDITERARSAAEIRALADALERRARDVEAVNRELETFAYSVSHDLRAPLRHISGYVQLLSRALGAPDAPGAPDALERDRALAALQTCDAFEPGVLLALRAELAPVACGDVIVGKELAPELDPELAQTLTALVHAAHLNRLVVTAPRLEPPFSKQQFSDFSKTVLEKWVVTQARAIYEIAKQGAILASNTLPSVATSFPNTEIRPSSSSRAPTVKSRPRIRSFTAITASLS